jgi:hypothetical protein
MEATDTLGDVEELINEVPEAVSKTAVDVVGLPLLLEEVAAAPARQRMHECLSTTLRSQNIDILLETRGPKLDIVTYLNFSVLSSRDPDTCTLHHLPSCACILKPFSPTFSRFSFLLLKQKFFILTCHQSCLMLVLLPRASLLHFQRMGLWLGLSGTIERSFSHQNLQLVRLVGMVLIPPFPYIMRENGGEDA